MADIDKDKFVIKGKPAPYIKFLHMKNIATNANGSVSIETKAEPCFVRADGCHATKESIDQLRRGGKKILAGYGNLVMPKHAELKAWLDAQLGIGVDPQLIAMRDSVMGVRIDERKRAVKSE